MKKLLAGLAAASMALTATPALADHHHGHDRGHHYGWYNSRPIYRSYTPRYYNYSPYTYTNSYWRYNNYYRCHRTNGGVGVLVDPYTGQLVFEIGSRRVVCR